MPPDFLDEFHRSAEAIEQEEAEYRRDSRRRLEGLETERTRAFRRYNLVKDMAAAVQAETADSVAAQVAVATAESGWSDAREGYAEVRDRLSSIAALIHAQLRPIDAASGMPEGGVRAALASFEAWYRERFGKDFLDLLGREVPSFQALVDF
ncbi:MAG TPA: hypothetical protein VMQ73_07245 [Methylomirabilota bacterium]|nr:hypothetical protein [Methylomirabilota bacterium]